MSESDTHQTLSLETYARNSSNYYQQMVDGKGQPYFNIFWADPAKAAHDVPDFVDEKMVSTCEVETIFSFSSYIVKQFGKLRYTHGENTIFTASSIVSIK